MRAFLSLKATMTATATATRTAKKATGLDWQNINFARAFFVHFFAVFVRLRRKIVLKIHVFVEVLNTRQRFSFPFLQLR